VAPSGSKNSRNSAPSPPAIRSIAEISQIDDIASRLFALSPDMIGATDFKGRILQINPSVENILGWSNHEVLGKSLNEYLIPGELEKNLSYKKVIMEKGWVHGFETWMKTRSGSQRCVQWSAILNSEHKQFYFIGRDVTDRVRTEEQLRRTFELLPVSFQNLDENGNILYVNQMWLETLGYEREEVIGRWFGDFLPEDNKPLFRDYFPSFRRRGRASSVEFRMLHKNGEIRHVLYNGVCEFNSDGAFVRTLCAFTDVTSQFQAEEEWKIIEQRINQAQKLESLSHLAGGVAHDFNNLLTGVIGNTDLLLSDLPEDSPYIETLNDIARASRHAAALARQMLTYSGRGMYSLGALNLSTIVTDLDQLIRSLVTPKVQIRYELAPNLPSLQGDKAKLQQAIMNIVENAAEAIGDKDGVITIRSEVLACNMDDLTNTYLADRLPEGDYLVLQVEDNGCGMSDDVRLRMFDPFFSTKFTGRGLGMPAVLGIVRAHKGAIRVESKQGVFARVRMYLPTGIPKKASASATLVLPAAEGKTLLLIDDDEIIRRLVTKTLERQGMNVLIAANGADALETFRKHRHEIAAVLLDLSMPRMSGRETLKDLRKIDTIVPIMLTSGYAEEMITADLAGYRPSGFLQKPFWPKDLIEKLSLLIRR